MRYDEIMQAVALTTMSELSATGRAVFIDSRGAVSKRHAYGFPPTISIASPGEHPKTFERYSLPPSERQANKTFQLFFYRENP